MEYNVDIYADQIPKICRSISIFFEQQILVEHNQYKT